MSSGMGDEGKGPPVRCVSKEDHPGASYHLYTEFALVY